MTQELEDQVSQLQAELGQVRAELDIARLERDEMKKLADGYVEEIKRCAKAGSDLLGSLDERQKEGDILRERLRKVTAAFQDAQQLIFALDAHSGVELARAAYSQSLMDLDTPDDPDAR